MTDPVIDSLPPQDARLLRRMAERAGVSEQAIAREIIRAYLGLVRGAPEALPDDPLRRRALSARRGER